MQESENREQLVDVQGYHMHPLRTVGCHAYPLYEIRPVNFDTILTKRARPAMPEGFEIGEYSLIMGWLIILETILICLP